MISMATTNPRSGMKVTIKQDRLGALVITPESDDIRRKVEDHLKLFGERDASVYIQQDHAVDEWMKEHLSTSERKQIQRGWHVTKIVDPYEYGMWRGWDVSELDLMPSKRAKNTGKVIPFPKRGKATMAKTRSEMIASRGEKPDAITRYLTRHGAYKHPVFERMADNNRKVQIYQVPNANKYFVVWSVAGMREALGPYDRAEARAVATQRMIEGGISPNKALSIMSKFGEYADQEFVPNPSKSSCKKYVSQQIRRQYHEGKVGRGRGKRSREQAIAIAFSKAETKGCDLPQRHPNCGCGDAMRSNPDIYVRIKDGKKTIKSFETVLPPGFSSLTDRAAYNLASILSSDHKKHGGKRDAVYEITDGTKTYRYRVPAVLPLHANAGTMRVYALADYKTYEEAVKGARRLATKEHGKVYVDSREGGASKHRKPWLVWRLSDSSKHPTAKQVFGDRYMETVVNEGKNVGGFRQNPEAKRANVSSFDVKNKDFHEGQVIRHTAAFRRSVGMYTGNIDGVVLKTDPKLGWVFVAWSEGHGSWISTANIEPVGSSSTGYTEVTTTMLKSLQKKYAKKMTSNPQPSTKTVTAKTRAPNPTTTDATARRLMK